MPKKRFDWKAVVIPALLTLLIGGSSPWWFDRIFGSLPRSVPTADVHKDSVPGAAVSPGSKPSENSPIASHTEPALRPREQSFGPGDLATNGKRAGDANYGDVIWNGSEQPKENWIQFNVSSPVEHDFDLFITYASGDDRPLTVLVGDTAAGTFHIPLTGSGIAAYYYQQQSEHRITRLHLPKGLSLITIKNPSALPHISGVRVVPSGHK